MPFESAFDDIYRFGIKGAAEDVGAYAERVDEQTYAEGILDRIFNQINKADVIVADMTGRNANVFYEVGYAHALGKTVLLLTQDADDIPFDLKHRQHTVYGGKIDNLRKQLSAKLSWAISESQRRKRPRRSESLVVATRDVILSELPTDENPTVRLDIEHDTKWFPLSFSVRNASPEQTETITHIYLLAKSGTKIVPVEEERGGHYSRMHPIETGAEEFPICFRLKASILPLPAEAADQIRVTFRFASDQYGQAEANFRLRIHGAEGIHDYAFRLEVLRMKPPTIR